MLMHPFASVRFVHAKRASKNVILCGSGCSGRPGNAAIGPSWLLLFAARIVIDAAPDGDQQMGETTCAAPAIVIPSDM
uniref:Uncharacterized protein n=1 Tax=Romanomermis culicivorax TaxID=13658 RepID=A0A915LAV3_ROMCU